MCLQEDRLAESIKSLVEALECERTQVRGGCMISRASAKVWVNSVKCLARLLSLHLSRCTRSRLPSASLQAVRASIVAALPVCDITLEALLERTQDVSHEVRSLVRLGLWTLQDDVARCHTAWGWLRTLLWLRTQLVPSSAAAIPSGPVSCVPPSAAAVCHRHQVGVNSK